MKRFVFTALASFLSCYQLIPSASALPAVGVRAQAVDVVSPDRAVPVTSYPSQPVISGPDRKRGWCFTFMVPGSGTPSATSVLLLNFATPPEMPAKSLACEVYLLDGQYAEGVLTTSNETFLGSAIPSINPKDAHGAIMLEAQKPFLTPGQTVHLLMIPIGDPGKSPPLALNAAPVLAIVPQGPAIGDSMQLLWTGERTADESVVFFRSKPSEMAEATLLHKPRKIERVYSYFTGTAYAEGVDWKLTEKGTLVAPHGSSIKVTSDEELHPTGKTIGRVFKTNSGRILSSIEGWNRDRDVWVTYTHDNDWQGPIPAFAEKELPRTLAMLRAKKPLKLVVYGDSISEGAGATGRGSQPPYLLPWANLIAADLRAHYRAPVTMVNRALGGASARWGAENAATLVEPEAPDLCIIAFGMNDRGGNVPVSLFMNQIEEIMKAARAGNPSVEFILVSSMRNNPEWGPTQPLLDYRDAMLKMQGPGVAVADMTACHETLLKKKPFIDMSSNNVNHPNDYLVRWYAQVIAALLVPSPAPAQ